MKLLAKTYANFEPLLAEELEALGATNVNPVRRGVLFEGDNHLLYKVNYLSRLALRILVNVKTTKVNDEDELYNFVSKIAWEDYFTVNQSFAVDATATSKVFTHSQYVAQKTKDAIVDRFRRKFHKRPNVNRVTPNIRINIYINDRLCTVSLDSSGDSLHKRGYKMHQTNAPLSEVLAAGMLRFAEYDGSQTLLDPMCGSGTIGMEAFMLKRNIPAGYFREEYAFQNWNHYKPDIWQEVKSEADADIRQANDADIICYDKQLSAIRKTQENHSVFEEFNPVEFKTGRKDFFKLRDVNTDLIIMNPPYDQKIEVEDILGFYQKIGDAFKTHFQGCTAWIISGNLDAMKYVGLKTSQRIDLFNGPTPAKYYKYEMYAGSRKEQS